MADTIVQNQQGLVTRETYFQMKQDQKDTALVLKGTLNTPEAQLRLGSSTHARHLNIVYSVIRGRKYRQVEQKYREHNEPDKYWIAKVCAEYGIDEIAFNAAAEIDYGI